MLLNEVLAESIKLAQAQIAAKNPDLKNKEQVAEEVGVGAVIFGDLKKMNELIRLILICKNS